MCCRPLPSAAWGPAKSGVPRRAPRPRVAGGWNASSPRRQLPVWMACHAPAGACRQRLSPQPSPAASDAGARSLVQTKDGAGANPPPLPDHAKDSAITGLVGAPRGCLTLAAPCGRPPARAASHARVHTYNVNPLRRQAQDATRNRPSLRGVCYDWPQQPPPPGRAIPMGVAWPANRVARRLSPHPREWRLLRRFGHCLAGDPTVGGGCRFRPAEKRRHRHPTTVAQILNSHICLRHTGGRDRVGSVATATRGGTLPSHAPRADTGGGTRHEASAPSSLFRRPRRARVDLW